jgi:hypothetical protein
MVHHRVNEFLVKLVKVRESLDLDQLIDISKQMVTLHKAVRFLTLYGTVTVAWESHLDKKPTRHVATVYLKKQCQFVYKEMKKQPFSLPCLLTGSKYHLHNFESNCVITLPHTCYAKFAVRGLLQKQIQRKTEARMFMPSQQKRNIKINNVSNMRQTSNNWKVRCGAKS